MTGSRDDWLKTGGGMAALPDRESAQIERLIGRVLSGYRVTDVLGTGGMGLVLHAERSEGDFERAVAIKLVPGGVSATALTQRFQIERKILASLNHPFIAQLYDAGETEEGWPYLVMEYVDGDPIDVYCRSRNLPHEARVALLEQVTQAVAFAHARLVVHRDIKPSNVMVTRDGMPKLLDFGIARLIDPTDTHETQAERLLTPQYASPEQLLGSEITTGSDVYQLGALFLAVLADESPFEETSLHDAISRAASGREVTIPDAARAKIPADLVATIEKCLRTTPADRYVDVGALLADVGNYRRGFPVTARHGATLYRVRKFVARNKAASLFAGLAAVIAAAGSAVYTVDLQRARDLAEARANTTSRLLQALSEMLTDTYTELMETSGQRRDASDAYTDLQNEPLRLVLERTNRLIGETLTDVPELRARLLNVQGMTNRELNRLEAARAQLTESLAISRSIADPDLEVEVLTELAKLALFAVDAEEAAVYVQQAFSIAADADVSPRHLANLLAVAARADTLRSDYPAAIEHALASIRILEEEPDAPSIALARAYAELGDVYIRLEQREPMRLWMQKAIDLYLDLEGPKYRGLQRPYSGMAWSYASSGEYVRAREYVLKEIDIALANFGERHLKTVFAYNNLGIIERRMGDPAAALESFGRVLQQYRDLDMPLDRQMANLHLNLGNTYQDIGDLDRAASHFEQGLAIENLADRDPRSYAYFLNNYGNLLDIRGEVERGRTMLRDAVAVKSDVFGPRNVSTARSMLYLAESQIRMAEESDAAELIRQARLAFEENYGAGHRKMSFPTLVEARLARLRGDLSSAMAGLETALAMRLEEYDERHRETVVVLCELARTAAMAGDAGAARRWLDRATPGISDLGKTSAEYVEARVVTAEVLIAEERGGEAARVVSEVAALVRAHYPARSDWTDRIAALELT